MGTGGAQRWAGAGPGRAARGGARGFRGGGGARREKFREGGPPAQTRRGSCRRARVFPDRPVAMSSGGAGSGGPEGAPRAAAALCGLYHEAGQRLRRLQDQLAARDALIARLRARLAALEGDAAPSLVDALLEQVARFREQLRQQDGGAAEAALRQVRSRVGGGRVRLAELGWAGRVGAAPRAGVGGWPLRGVRAGGPEGSLGSRGVGC